MKIISKYLLLLFLVENLCTQTILLYSYTMPIFYMLLGFGILMVLRPSNWSFFSFGRFGWIFFLSVIYILHCFVVGLEFLDQENILYLIAKIATFFIIITSLNENLEYYEEKGIFLFVLIASCFIIYGFIMPGAEIEFDGEMRNAFGFVNPNAMGGIATIIFGVLICKYRYQRWPIWALIFCVLSVFGVMASGSRSSIIVLVLMFLSQYKFSFKTVFYVVMALLLLIVVLPKIGVEITGVNRMQATLSGELGSNRGDERLAAEIMIQERPWTGWGLVTENQGRAAQVTMMSSHHSYLDLAKTMGIPLAIIWTLAVVSVVIKYLFNMRRYDLPFDFFCVYVLCTLFKGFFEAMFAGAHEIQTNIFYVSLAVLSMRLYNARICR